jgi:hypothetical protein
MYRSRNEIKAKDLQIEIKRCNLILDWMCGKEIDKEELLLTLRLFMPHMGIGRKKLVDLIEKSEKELAAIQSEVKK